MSHTLSLNEELGVIVLRAQQPMTFSEICLVFKEMVGLTGFREGLFLVADFRGSATLLTGEDMRQLAAHASVTDAAWGDTKWVILASTDLMYGLSRMFGMLTDDLQVTTHAFRGAREADDWLGLGVDVEEILARTPAPQARRFS